MTDDTAPAGHNPRPSLLNLGLPAGERLKASQETVAVAESSTGGLISAALLAVPGASAYFQGGSVIYTLAARKVLLGITKEDVAGAEPLTELMVSRFAEVARQQLGTTWALSELGVAGPTPARYGHAAGLSVIAVAGPRPRAITIETGSADREENMWRFTEAALSLLAEAVAS